MPIKNEREYRGLVLEVRKAEEADENDLVVEGYATTFNSPYLLYEYKNWYDQNVSVYEVVDRHAFDNCDMSDVIMQYDHEGRVFARTKNGTLELKCDQHGLFVRAHLGGTEQGKQLYEEIKGGYTTKMSFGFIVEESDVKAEETELTVTKTRTITKISKLFDVSAVSLPANDQTEISARKFGEGVIAELEAERLKRAKSKLKLKLKLGETR